MNKSRRGAVLPGAAGRQENQFRLLVFLAKSAGKRNDPNQVETPFGLFESEHRVAFDDIPMTGEVKRLKRAVLRDPLSEELDRAAFLDIEVERQPIGRLQNAGFLLLVIEHALSLDFGRHEQHGQIAKLRRRRRARAAEAARHAKQPFVILGEEPAVPPQQFPRYVEKDPLALFRLSGHGDVERDLTDRSAQDPVEPTVAFIEKCRDVPPDVDQRGQRP